MPVTKSNKRARPDVDASAASQPPVARSKTAAPSGISGLLSDSDIDVPKSTATSSAPTSKSSTGTGLSFGPTHLRVNVPLVASDGDSLQLQIKAINVRSKVHFQTTASRKTYFQFKCTGATCEAKLVYHTSEDGLILNEQSSQLVHSCRSDAAQEATREAQSAKSFSRSQLSLKQMLQLADEHNVDVSIHKTAQSYMDAVLRAANLTSATLGRSAMYNLYRAANEIVSRSNRRQNISNLTFRLDVWHARNASRSSRSSVCKAQRTVRRRRVHEAGDQSRERQAHFDGILDCHAVRARDAQVGHPLHCDRRDVFSRE